MKENLKSLHQFAK